MGIGSVRRVGLVAVAVIAVVSACSGSDETSDSSSGPSDSLAATATSDEAATDVVTTEALSTEPPTTEARDDRAGDDPEPATTGGAAPAGVAPDQWTAVDPVPGCMCMDGSPFELWDRPADPTKVVLYFEGGGACFSAETCAFDNSTAMVNLDLGTPPSGRGGLFDQTNRRIRSPTTRWSTCRTPAGRCAHRQQDDRAPARPHRPPHGYVNATPAATPTTWSPTYPDVEELVVTGAQAGARSDAAVRGPGR